jgi:hypothetical protein
MPKSVIRTGATRFVLQMTSASSAMIGAISSVSSQFASLDLRASQV